MASARKVAVEFSVEMTLSRAEAEALASVCSTYPGKHQSSILAALIDAGVSVVVPEIAYEDIPF